MARPSLLRPKDGGEILLKNVSAEVKEKIKDLLEGDNTPQLVTPEGTVPAVDPTEAEFTHLALGVCKVGNDWCVASIRYNPISQECSVESVEIVGATKAHAEHKFKMDAIRRGVL